MSEPRTPQVPMVDQNGQPFYPLTQYNQIVMPGGGRWDGNPGSSVELDTTLKEAGKAADAAAVGAAVNELKDDKVNQKGWTGNKYLGTDENGNVIEKALPTASADIAGIVKIGSDFTVDENGVLYLALPNLDEVSY